MQTGPLMLHDQLSRALGADIPSREAHVRMSEVIVDFYAQALLGREQAAAAHAGYDRLQAQGA